MEIEAVKENKGGKSPHFNGMEVGRQFFEYFYKTWSTDPDALARDCVVRPYSKMQYNSTVFEGENFIMLLKQFAYTGLEITNCKYEIFDTGSRQIHILVNGMMRCNMIGTDTKHFSQFILIVYMGEKAEHKWALQSSILNIM
jgi:hypothetical protein